MSNRFFPNYDSYIITSRFGQRIHPVTGVKKMHNGIDLVATSDGNVGQVDKIMAHTGGVVDGVGFDPDAGNFVRIRVDLDTKMYYFHLQDMSSLVAGDVVQSGQIIGTMGETGKVAGKHLHFGIKKNGEWIDPEPYLDKDYVQEGGNSMSKKICLDAGHYGKYNRSPVVKEYYESEMNWKLHLLLKKYLEQYGFEVITNRASQDKDLALYSRGAASKGCDIFLSIHSNACDTESVDYPVAIVPVNGSGDVIGKKLADCIAATMGTTQKGKFAFRKGSNGDYYGVIRGAVAVGVPGLILEHSFHTNTRAAKWLLDESNLDKLAKAEADVIADYFGVEKVEKPATDSTGTDKKVELAVDGKWGKATTTRLQKIFGTSVDGVVSNQWECYKNDNPGLTSGWDWRKKPNGNGSQLIKAMQKWAGMPSGKQDGQIGPSTIKAFQKKLGTTADGYVSSPSAMVKALQKWANKQ